MKKFLLLALASCALAQADIVQLSKKNLPEILNSSKPVVIDVYTDWCGPCQMFAPVFKEVSKLKSNEYLFVKLDGDKDDGLLNYFKVRSFPTLIFLKDGKETSRQVGFLNKPAFLTQLEKSFQRQSSDKE